MDNANFTEIIKKRGNPTQSPCQKKIMSSDEKDSFCPFPRMEFSISSLVRTACSYAKLSLNTEGRL